MTDWHIGQKVVCVDADDINPYWIVEGSLDLGAVYTIRSVRPAIGEPGIAIYLKEVTARVCWDGSGIETAFFSWRFRPVVEPKADISVFQSILDRLPKREVVDA
jgi:hypothetical protein